MKTRMSERFVYNEIDNLLTKASKIAFKNKNPSLEEIKKAQASLDGWYFSLPKQEGKEES